MTFKKKKLPQLFRPTQISVETPIIRGNPPPLRQNRDKNVFCFCFFHLDLTVFDRVSLSFTPFGRFSFTHIFHTEIRQVEVIRNAS